MRRPFEPVELASVPASQPVTNQRLTFPVTAQTCLVTHSWNCHTHCMGGQGRAIERRLQPTWLLIAWLPICIGQIWLNTSVLRRDGFAWAPMLLVIGASILLGMVVTDLQESFARRRAARVHREPADPRDPASDP